MNKLTLYRHPLSGHSHRAELLLSLLAIDTELVDVDLTAGAHKRDDFLTYNRFGQIPVLRDGSTVIADSNAILVYLALRYDDEARNWYPAEPALAGEVQRFLSVAAGPLASGPAAARLVNVFGASLNQARAIALAHQLLTILDTHLTGKQWLVGTAPTIADVANYSYLAHAPEGDIALDAYANVGSWLERMQRLPGFVPMQNSAVGLAT